MGSCFSTISSQDSSPSTLTAKVITLNGALLEYSVTVTTFQVLEQEGETSSSFICNSDQLYYEEYIQSLDANEVLRMGQIYFILPMSKLQYPLTGADMAGLAVKASSALVNTNKSVRGRKRIRVVPDLDMSQGFGEENGVKRFEKPTGGIARSGSVRKLHRSASRRAKVAIRSFRIRLSTIYEGSVVSD